MPTVPTIDNFRVMPTAQPVAATDTGISPAQATVGARLLMNAGEQITQAGKDYADIEIDALQQANQLRVDDALNQAKEASLKMTYDPEVGYQNIKGIDALQRPSGLSLADEYGGELDKTFGNIEATLSNEAQKIAFRKNANNILTAFKGDATQHEGQEFQTYGLSVGEGTIKNRTAEIVAAYNNPEKVAESVASIKAATYRNGKLLGKSAEWIEAEAREATSKAHRMVVMTAMEKNNPTYADAYMQKNAKEMNPDDILAVSGTLTKQMDGQIGLTTATAVMQDLGPRIQTSESDRAFNIALGTESNHRQFDATGKPLTSPAGAIGIAQVMPGTAPEAAKLAGLEWDENKYKNDPEYNRALGKAYFAEQLRQNNGNLAMAYAAYNAGPGRLQEGLTAAKKKGEPQNWLQEMPAETQNYVSKNMKEFGAGGGQYQKPTLLEVQAEVRKRIGEGQPDRLKIALDESERQYKMVEEATKQKYAEAKANAMRTLMQNGGRFTDLPAGLRGELDPNDVSAVMEFGKKISNGDDTTSLYLYQKLSADPAALKNMTDDQFFALRAELSQTDFKHFADQRASLINGTGDNSPGSLNNEAINRVTNDRLNSMGIDPTPEDGSTNAERVGALRRFINQSIAVEQTNRGKKMNDVEISGFIDTLLAQKSSVFHDGTFSGPRITKINDIPSDTKNALKAAFKRNGVENPTDADLLNAYWRQTSLINSKTKKPKNG